MTTQDDVFAVLTPPGVAAVATVAMSGPNCWSIARGIFHPNSGRLPETPAPDQIWVGRFKEPSGDFVVLAVRDAGAKPWIELHCHGGRAAIQQIADKLTDRGLVNCSFGEFIRIAHNSLSVAQTTMELTRAPTVRAAGILLDQIGGAFRASISSIGSAFDIGDLSRVKELVGALASHVNLGRHLTRPWRVVVAGAPNVGKSSLINAVAGFHRSVVASTPGTTRDLVTTSVAIEGWPVDLIDTAGLRLMSDALEGQGIARARAAMAEADLCLWIFDASADSIWPDDDRREWLPVVNKIDLPAISSPADIPYAISVSAKTGAGLAELCGGIGRRLVPQPPSPGTAVPFTPELCDRVETIGDLVRTGELGIARQELDALLELASK